MCLEYDFKQSNGESPTMEIWGIWNILSLSLLLGPLWLRVVSLDRVLSMGQIDLFNIQTVCKQMTYAELLEIEMFDRLTVYKQMTNV